MADVVTRNPHRKRMSHQMDGTEEYAAPGVMETTPRLTERQQLALLLRTSALPSTQKSPVKIQRNKKGETMVHVAAMKNDLRLLKSLIREGHPVDVTDNAGWTPLHEACNHGHKRIVWELVKAGANINYRGYNDETPLHDACYNKHVKLIKMLLLCGANTDLPNRTGRTAVDLIACDQDLAKHFRRLIVRKTNASQSSTDSRHSEISSLSPVSFYSQGYSALDSQPSTPRTFTESSESEHGETPAEEISGVLERSSFLTPKSYSSGFGPFQTVSPKAETKTSEENGTLSNNLSTSPGNWIYQASLRTSKMEVDDICVDSSPLLDSYPGGIVVSSQGSPRPRTPVECSTLNCYVGSTTDSLEYPQTVASLPPSLPSSCTGMLECDSPFSQGVDHPCQISPISTHTGIAQAPTGTLRDEPVGDSWMGQIPVVGSCQLAVRTLNSAGAWDSSIQGLVHSPMLPSCQPYCQTRPAAHDEKCLPIGTSTCAVCNNNNNNNNPAPCSTTCTFGSSSSLEHRQAPDCPSPAACVLLLTPREESEAVNSTSVPVCAIDDIPNGDIISPADKKTDSAWNAVTVQIASQVEPACHGHGGSSGSSSSCEGLLDPDGMTFNSNFYRHDENITDYVPSSLGCVKVVSRCQAEVGPLSTVVDEDSPYCNSDFCHDHGDTPKSGLSLVDCVSMSQPRANQEPLSTVVDVDGQLPSTCSIVLSFNTVPYPLCLLSTVSSDLADYAKLFGVDKLACWKAIVERQDLLTLHLDDMPSSRACTGRLCCEVPIQQQLDQLCYNYSQSMLFLVLESVQKMSGNDLRPPPYCSVRNSFSGSSAGVGGGVMVSSVRRISSSLSRDLEDIYRRYKIAQDQLLFHERSMRRAGLC